MQLSACTHNVIKRISEEKSHNTVKKRTRGFVHKALTDGRVGVFPSFELKAILQWVIFFFKAKLTGNLKVGVVHHSTSNGVHGTEGHLFTGTSEHPSNPLNGASNSVFS